MFILQKNGRDSFGGKPRGASLAKKGNAQQSDLKGDEKLPPERRLG